MIIRTNGPRMGEDDKFLDKCTQRWLEEGHKLPIPQQKYGEYDISTTIDGILEQTSGYTW